MNKMKEVFRKYIDLDMMPLNDALSLIRWRSHVVSYDIGVDNCFMDVLYNEKENKWMLAIIGKAFTKEETGEEE